MVSDNGIERSPAGRLIDTRTPGGYCHLAATEAASTGVEVMIIAETLDYHRTHALGAPTTIYLKSGRTLTGKVQNVDKETVTIRDDAKWYQRKNISYYIVLTEIEAIEA